MDRALTTVSMACVMFSLSNSILSYLRADLTSQSVKHIYYTRLFRAFAIAVVFADILD